MPLKTDFLLFDILRPLCVMTDGDFVTIYTQLVKEEELQDTSSEKKFVDSYSISSLTILY